MPPKLLPDRVGVPVRWLVRTSVVERGHQVDVSDPAMHAVLGAGTRRALKSFGHDADGVHFLLHRDGTTLHTDTAYLRYSAQLVLRNDGTRIRGEADAPEDWHPPLAVGTMYLLDTHSPHQGLADSRLECPRAPMKAVIAVDRPEPITPAEAWPLLSRLLAHQFADFPVNARPPRWRPEPMGQETPS